MGKISLEPFRFDLVPGFRESRDGKVFGPGHRVATSFNRRLVACFCNRHSLTLSQLWPCYVVAHFLCDSFVLGFTWQFPRCRARSLDVGGRFEDVVRRTLPSLLASLKLKQKPSQQFQSVLNRNCSLHVSLQVSASSRNMLSERLKATRVVSSEPISKL